MRFNDTGTLESYFKAHNLPTYERLGYDRYLKDKGFFYNVPSIHITGTNGKGSTSSFIQSIYHAQGYKTALYTSPYFEKANEMMVIDGAPISDDRLLAYMNARVEEFETYHLTTFEMQTLIALEYFTDEKVDVAVIEVGMGGLVDATNIFTPILSILTNVALEHTRFLGNTVKEIATAKSGIIKDHVPTLYGRLDEEAYAVVYKAAFLKRSELSAMKEPTNVRIEGNLKFDYDDLKDLEVTSHALYQADNAALAISAVRLLASRFPVSKSAIRTGLKTMFIPGRLEILEGSPTIILDGCHNPHAASALVETMKTFGNIPIYIVFAAFKDKNVDAIFQSLSEISKKILVTSFDHVRARHREDYENLIYPYVDDYKEAMRITLARAPKRSIILMTGSLAFIGVVRHDLKEGKKL